MDFSEREGHKKPIHTSLGGMGSDVKNAIWTEIYKTISSFISYGITGYGDSSYLNKKWRAIVVD